MQVGPFAPGIKRALYPVTGSTLTTACDKQANATREMNQDSVKS
jgi:hypothetical protein